jgi:hypothetical protein
LDSIRIMRSILAMGAGMVFLQFLAGCKSGSIAAREVLADPLMRLSQKSALGSPTETVKVGIDPVIPPDTVMSRLNVDLEPGDGAKAVFTESSIRGTAEVFTGIALEAGYQLRTEKQLIQKLDGFSGPLHDERLWHGPLAALVVDDGVSSLRLGYRYRTCDDGETHEPSILARTSILHRDTVVEAAYRQSTRSLNIPASHWTATGLDIHDRIQSDSFSAAIEQGFLPGWNIRLDLESVFEHGFLQSPFRLVSLWSQRTLPTGAQTFTVPTMEPERHPSSRIRWASMLRVRRLIQAASSSVEIGAGYGSDTWRIEQEQVEAAYHQKLGQRLILSLGGGGYHQTRASFYRDEYPEGPVGSYWSADRNLCSFLLFFGEASATLFFLPERMRALGLFKHIRIEAGARINHRNDSFEGIDSQNGFTSFRTFAGGTRGNFDGALFFSGWLTMEGGF